MGRFLIKRGCVLTLGARTPNHAEADVLIEDGRIAEIGTGLRARDAETIDAADTIVMPGFVDTHRHAWKSLLRNVGGGSARDGAPLAAHYAAHHQPDDVYAATLLGLLTAAEAGITTVVDWFDVAAGDGFREAALQAHADAGVRTVFVQAPPVSGSAATGSWPAHEAALRGLAEDSAGRPRTTIAFGSPDPEGRSDLAPGADDDARVGLASQWSLARELGLRIHVHARSGGVVDDLARRGLLAADVTLVHCSVASATDLDAITAAGAGVSLTPANEMALSHVAPPLQQLIDRGIRPGLGVDDETLAPGDLFAQMHTVQSLQHATMFDLKLAGKAGLPSLLSTREVIRYATIDGARVAGLADVTGSLEVGKQADLILLRTDRPNIAPVNDPIGAVVWGMDPSNVDWVFVGGTPLMRAGTLVGDVARVRSLALAASQRVMASAGDLIGSPSGGPA